MAIPLTISGIVVDYATGVPLANAAVKSSLSGISTLTDTIGKEEFFLHWYIRPISS